MKLHWGYSILIFFICYVSFLVFTVFKSRTIDNGLVMENYYDHDIAYQKRYEAVMNRSLLKKDLSIAQSVSDKAVTLDFGNDATAINGSFTFYRPNNKRSDRKGELEVENGKQSISTASLTPGRWIIKVAWADAERDYYKEEEIYINNT